MGLKAWMVYLIGIIIVVTFPLALVLVSLGDQTGEGIGYDIGSLLGTSIIVGGGVLLLYYAIKSIKKKK